MILGCGIDLVEVARFERELVRRDAVGVRPQDRQGPRRGGAIRDAGDFDDVLTPAEMIRSQALRRPALGHAAAFAAKEACFKALGTGKVGAMSWHDVEIGRAEGRYTVTLGGETAAVAHRLGVDEIHLSLASTRSRVVALVIAEGGCGERADTGVGPYGD